MTNLEQQVESAWPPIRWRDVTVLVAVSGGADSVALLRALGALAGRDSGARLAVAHYNHALRGAASDADERFVAELAANLGLVCHVGRPTGGLAGDRSEEASRGARYEFLQATAHCIGARYVATAHTADDQAETVLHHVLRGTGLAGLAGMPQARELAPGVALVRPLVGVRRSEILAYLAELGQPFREDASNRDAAYTRNRLRHDLLPRLAADYNPRVVEALLRLASLAGEAQTFVEAQAAELTKDAVVASSRGRVVIDIRKMIAQSRYLVREVLISLWRDQNWPLQTMGHAQWELLAELAIGSMPPGGEAKRVLPGEILAHRTAERLTLQAMNDEC